MATVFRELPLSAGGTGAVDSVNGQIGDVVLTYADIGPIPTPVLLDNGSVSSPSYGFADDGDQDTGMYTTGDGNISFATNGVLRVTMNNVGLTINGDLAADNFPPSGTNNSFAGFDSSGDLESIPGFTINALSGGLDSSLTFPEENGQGSASVHSFRADVDPSEDSPSTTVSNTFLGLNLDPNSSGFDMGTGGDCSNVLNLNINHQGTSDTGRLAYINTSAGIGNGTDPISILGVAMAYGNANIADNVTIDGSIQGWGFNPNVASGAIGTSSFYGRAFYDFSSINIPISGYDSVIANPQISAITNNHNVVGFNYGPHILELEGNSNCFGIALSPTVDLTGSGSIQCISASPTVTLNKGNAVGLNVNMSNVTNYPGVVSSLVLQDITYTSLQAGTDGNNVTVEYEDSATAGSEVASLAGQAIKVTMESGVSTATQIKAAIDMVPSIGFGVSTAITGMASDAQTSVTTTNLEDGENPGTKKAAAFNGDVSIEGNLSFTGGLSIGSLSSFASRTLITGAGGVQSIDTLITSPSVPASTTITGADFLGVNTASLMTFGANSSTSTNFIGITALGLPAVVQIGAGAMVDNINGAAFALSLSGSPGAGTVDIVNLCKALAIPDGNTTVNELRGFAMDLPFGNVGTDIWGVYISPTSAHNFMAGDLKVGGDSLPSNDSVGIELESTVKAVLLSRMTTVQRDALTTLEGMLVYNTTDSKFQGYASGVWVDFH